MANAKKTAKTEVSDKETVVGTHNLSPSTQQDRPRKRVGRGHGSGMGKTSGRGHKGQGSRSGGKPGPHYEGGQTPIHMRMRKLRGATKKTSMPVEPFRTATQPVNLDDLVRVFKAGDTVNAETLSANGLATRKNVAIKILARGEIDIKLDITAAKFSAEAQRKIEAAGGTCKTID